MRVVSPHESAADAKYQSIGMALVFSVPTAAHVNAKLGVRDARLAGQAEAHVRGAGVGAPIVLDEEPPGVVAVVGVGAPTLTNASLVGLVLRRSCSAAAAHDGRTAAAAGLRARCKCRRLSVPPQPSLRLPQFLPCAEQVVGVQVHRRRRYPPVAGDEATCPSG